MTYTGKYYTQKLIVNQASTNLFFFSCALKRKFQGFFCCALKNASESSAQRQKHDFFGRGS